ncbi:B12-binding domain-containing protein [Clostridium thailandense]|uniref:cobalamin B12-binding domain-containing protein n=1 Tax=Clostridium thailandense TaxID=2794346 RepID=UPI00398A2CAE
MSKILIEAMAELNEDLVIEEVKNLMNNNVPAMDIISYLQKGIEIVGKRFEEKIYFMSELIISGEIFKEASEILGTAIPTGTSKYGIFVIGTIYGDIHDIGKNIVSTVMSGNDFEVIDLGVDVPPEKFIEAIRNYKPKAVAISCLLTNCFDNVKKCIEDIEASGLRNETKIVIGGGPLDEDTCKYVKADVICKTAQQTVEYCKKMYVEKKEISYLKVIQ